MHLRFHLLLRVCAWVCLGLTASLRAAEPAWSLVWADEFDSGTKPDPTKWVYETGGDGWGNEELQTYTSRTNNVRIEGGNLVIEARKESFTGTDGRVRNYTSGRLKTLGKASWAYGRMEARIKVPRGQGLWPAFWMMGTNITTVGWPDGGEIDIMENIGKEPTQVHGTIHGPGYSGAGGIGKAYTLPGAKLVADDFHLFAVEWETNRIRWSVDGVRYFTVTPGSLPAGKTWVFTAPQFLLLNVAVGGNWPGAPNDSTVFPQRMLVDYVRVYARTSAPVPEVRLETVPDGVEARWPLLFPHALLERANELDTSWRTVITNGRRSGTEFATAVSPGFYRVRWTP